ncbi:MAG: TlpA family protein disulfide reductase [Hydrogenophilaceae bacterium]|nr:TlpA family protein disulfide reductase [Hydrogenophilaceae bacterium]
MQRKITFYLLARALLLGGFLLGLGNAARAADFTLTDSTGKIHKLSQYKGKWVLVNFWATWCPPCLAEIPDLNDLHEDKKSNVAVFGIALQYANPKQVIDFAEGLMVSYPIVLGNPKIASQIGPVDGLPTTYLYNPHGKLVAHQLGPITKEAVVEFIRGADKSANK